MGIGVGLVLAARRNPWSTRRRTQRGILRFSIPCLEPLSEKKSCHLGILCKMRIGPGGFCIIEAAWRFARPNNELRPIVATGTLLIFPPWNVLPFRFNLLFDGIWPNSAASLACSISNGTRCDRLLVRRSAVAEGRGTAFDL